MSEGASLGESTPSKRVDEPTNANTERSETTEDEAEEPEKLTFSDLHAEVDFTNPYDDVDWETYGSHKGQFHVHPHYGELGPPHEIYDLYVDLGYDVINLQPKSDLEEGMPWPLEEMGVIQDEWESRSPAEDGVVAIPGAEYADPQHITGVFTELMQDGIFEYIGSGSMNDPEYQYETVEQIVKSEPVPESVTPLAFIGHPGRYKGDDGQWNDGWLDHYKRLIDDFGGLLGLEAITYSFSYDDRDLWDELLSHAAPNRPVIGTSVDDTGEVEYADRGWVTFYLAEDEFDPSNQQRTQESIHRAWISGQTSFSTTAEPQMEAPTIESIRREEEAGTISIEATGYDVIEWVSAGEVIETGESITIANNESIESYVRAQIVEGNPNAPDSITCTQAWHIEDE